MSTPAPLRVLHVHPGEFVTRFVMTDHSHVVAHRVGPEPYTCIARACQAERRYFDCEHVELVKAWDAAHPEGSEGSADANQLPLGDWGPSVPSSPPNATREGR